MKLLPVALNVQDKPCLIVGGGAVAARKAASLLECGARVTVVSPQLSDGFASLHSEIEHQARGFDSGDGAGFKLIFACTDKREVNAQIAREAQEIGAWCSVADDAPASDFHAAATIRRGEICIGVTTSGGSPALSKHLKARVEECVGPEYEALLQLMSERRTKLKTQIEAQDQRAQLWRAILHSDALELLKQQRPEAATALLDSLLNP